MVLNLVAPRFHQHIRRFFARLSTKTAPASLEAVAEVKIPDSTAKLRSSETRLRFNRNVRHSSEDQAKTWRPCSCWRTRFRNSSNVFVGREGGLSLDARIVKKVAFEAPRGGEAPRLVTSVIKLATVGEDIAFASLLLTERPALYGATYSGMLRNVTFGQSLQNAKLRRTRRNSFESYPVWLSNVRFTYVMFNAAAAARTIAVQ